MKLLLRFIIVLVFSCFNYLYSQDEILGVTQSRIKSRTSLPPLEVVIDSVLKNNAMLDYRNNSIKRIETDIKSKRIDITKHLSLFADARYGNFNNFSTSDNGQIVIPSATSSKQFNYSTGVFLNLPLFNVLNRKKFIKMAKLELEEAKSLAEAQEEEMRQRVITLYQEVLLKEKLLEIKAKGVGNGRVNMQMVEKEFRNGLVAVAEYVRITTMSTSLEIEYEQAKSEYLLAKSLLEDLAGFKFDIVTAN